MHVSEDTNKRMPKTRWTLLGKVKSASDPDRALLIAEFTDGYFYPIFCYTRRITGDEAKAEVLTNEFFVEKVISGKLFKTLKQEKATSGFRPYLKTALRNFLRDKRVIEPEDEDVDGVPLVGHESDNPIWILDNARKQVLVDQALDATKADLEHRKLILNYQIFEAYYLLPAGKTWSEIADDFGQKDYHAAQNRARTAADQFKRELVKNLTIELGSEEAALEEITYLLTRS
jgi:hypothetical protein